MNKYNISILVLIIICTSCIRTKSSSETSTATFENDSISIWVTESQKPNTSQEEKLKLQLKAFDFADNLSNDSLKANKFSSLSYSQNFITDSSLFRKINNRAISTNKKINDSSALGNAYWDLGYFLKKKFVKDSAFYYYSEALEIFDDIGDTSNSGEMYLHMASIQMEIKDYTASEANTIKAIENFKITNNNVRLYRCYNLLGILLEDISEFEKSLSYYNEALYYLRKSENIQFGEASIINNIGIVYRNSKQYTKAIENFEKVINTSNLFVKNPSLYAKALSNLATTKLYNKDTFGIHSLFTKSIDIKQKENDIASLASSYYSLSEYNIYKKDSISALNNAIKALDLSLESNNNERLLVTYILLANLDKEKAPYYFQKYTKLNDSLQREDRKQQNKFARIRFETDEFIAENIELESEKEILSKQKQIWIGIATGFFLLGLSIYIIINQRAKNQKLRFDQQQQANNQEIFNLMLTQKQKVDEVKRLEQKRISEELHDGVLGKMLGARMILTGLNKRTTDEAIHEKSKALGSLQEIENEIRSISHELSHSAYQNINNFTDSVETLLANNKNVNIKTIFHFNEDENWDSLAGDIKINVYRIIQETFQNAIKHSKCTYFEVTFYRNDDQFNVIMSDNGIGYNINKGKKGIGIRNITSRINKLNGTFHIDSSEGQGTTISLNIPINIDIKKNTNNNT
ncbi:signal transduction histidine kinase [Maribacter caenipelagi]|uniref:histidine kinase n=1 Tax=Maribacter caenipelagi TaxID=1447781 RepID=A0A4R7D663_9FLAO|nr:tetratricopeptide repeat-containing sensor histidine kinase [Maribacter caenipelagi]TDS15255.1 signal transduction histidine kinase [Maribacter caenipelagi]